MLPGTPLLCALATHGLAAPRPSTGRASTTRATSPALRRLRTAHRSDRACICLSVVAIGGGPSAARILDRAAAGRAPAWRFLRSCCRAAAGTVIGSPFWRRVPWRARKAHALVSECVACFPPTVNPVQASKTDGPPPSGGAAACHSRRCAARRATCLREDPQGPRTPSSSARHDDPSPARSLHRKAAPAAPCGRIAPAKMQTALAARVQASGEIAAAGKRVACQGGGAAEAGGAVATARRARCCLLLNVAADGAPSIHPLAPPFPMHAGARWGRSAPGPPAAARRSCAPQQ